MTTTISGSTGVSSNTGFSCDGISFADNAPSNTLVTDASGNVGIGTSSPTEKLYVKGSNAVNIVAESSGAFSFITYKASGTTTNPGWGASNNDMVAYTVGSERMRIDSSGNLLFNSGYGSVATAYGCRAWVNFNGTGTVAIRASGNVSSITDNGVGDYTVNFTTALVDAKYSMTASVGRGASGSDPRYAGMNLSDPTTSACRVTVFVGGTTPTYNDVEYCCFSFFR